MYYMMYLASFRYILAEGLGYKRSWLLNGYPFMHVLFFIVKFSYFTAAGSLEEINRLRGCPRMAVRRPSPCGC